MTSQHEFKNDVDRFMDHLKKAINLRLEADRRSRSMWRTAQDQLVAGAKLRKESDKMIENAENMVYELIDNAMEEGVLYAQSRD